MYDLSFMLLLVAFACLICRRFVAALGQPEFIGDIVAGIFIGSYFLEGSLPSIISGVDLENSLRLLRGLSELGLIWILIEVVWCSVHFRGESLKKKSTMVMALFSISVPFFVGAIIGYYSKDDLALGQSAIGYMLFCGIAFSVTALPVLAVMIDRFQIINRCVGGFALAAAIYTDAFAWISLALVVGVWGNSAEDGSSLLLRFSGLVSIFLSVLSIKWLIAVFNVTVDDDSPQLILVLLLVVVLCATLTHGLGFHYSIGAIAAIFALGKTQGLKSAWEKWCGSLSIVMVPVFFVGTGTMLKLSAFNEVELWLWIVIFVIAGVASKIIGSLLAGVLLGMRQRESLELGILMGTKGTAELVVLSVGHSASLLSDNSYMVLLLLSVVSTLLTVPLIILLNKFQGGGHQPMAGS